ncbi:MAG: hypothetical protein ACI8O8_001591 [Oleiphilaceae bacterium]|jgi:hypothetical protein
MQTIKTKLFAARYFSKLFILLAALCFSAFTCAELEELDDKKLNEQTGKEGITIDLSYKLSIGEIAYDFSDREQNADNRNKSLTPPTPRIEYHQGKN